MALMLAPTCRVTVAEFGGHVLSPVHNYFWARMPHDNSTIIGAVSWSLGAILAARFIPHERESPAQT